MSPSPEEARGATGAEAPLVSVCVCTFRRPLLLGALLDGLAAQRGAPPFEVVIVDNDRRRSAEPTVAAARVRYATAGQAPPLRYLVEPRQNIALARNRAVAAARGRFLALLDDDERPAPGWLAALCATAAACAADGVFGPVLADLPAVAPAWVRRGGFFDRPRHPTGAALPEGQLRTGNALLRRELLLGYPAPGSALAPARPEDAGSDGEDDPEPVNEPFDPAYGLSGGEDTVLLGRLQASGARFVWCDEAEAREQILPERLRLGWLLRRSFGGGCGYARHRLARDGRQALPLLVLRGAGALGVGALLAPVALPFGRHQALRLARVAAGGLGKLAGCAGLHLEPYRAAEVPRALRPDARGRVGARPQLPLRGGPPSVAAAMAASYAPRSSAAK